MSGAPHIVIVGGGVAGIELATHLARRGRGRVTLADRSLAHVWKPMLHTFAAGTARPDRQKTSFLAQAKASGFAFHAGALTSVDLGARQVLLAPYADPSDATRNDASDRLDYDVLVLAIGSRANDFGTPGVAEHCQTIDDLTEATAFHQEFRRRIFGALQRGEDLAIAIVGGGATGVELAAELKRAIDLTATYTSAALGKTLRLTLIESGPRLLSAFPSAISQSAARSLGQLGVDVRTGVKVSGADARGYILEGGGRIDAAMRVWAAGVKAPAALADIEGLERSKTGQLLVRPTLQTTNAPSVFAVGDCAALHDPQTRKPVPATAQAARQQAQHLGRCLGRRDLDAFPEFKYREKGELVSLADYNGWGTLGRYTFGGGRFKGLSARLAHELLYRQHQFGLYGAGRGALNWLLDDLDRLVSAPVQLD